MARAITCIWEMIFYFYFPFSVFLPIQKVLSCCVRSASWSMEGEVWSVSFICV